MEYKNNINTDNMARIKKINEFRNDDRYYYFSEAALEREVYVPETYGEEFTKQFDDMSNRQLYDALNSLYDFAGGDTRPDMNDREEMLQWLYEYAYSMLEDELEDRGSASRRIGEAKTYTGRNGLIESRIDQTLDKIKDTSEILINEIIRIIEEKGENGELVFENPKPTSLFGGGPYESHWYEIDRLVTNGNTVTEVSDSGMEQNLAETYFTDLVAIYRMIS